MAAYGIVDGVIWCSGWRYDTVDSGMVQWMAVYGTVNSGTVQWMAVWHSGWRYGIMDGGIWYSG